MALHSDIPVHRKGVQLLALAAWACLQDSLARARAARAATATDHLKD